MSESAFFIDGPAGLLEAIYTLPEAKSPIACGIICHPHPLYGGTMHNKVVSTLARAFAQLDLMTVRFQFRGVGKSVGEYDDGRGEYEDLLAVIQWVQKTHPKLPIWLAGFSFGGYIAALGATQVPIARLVLVAPAVEHFPVRELPPITCPWVVVQGEMDDVVSPHAVLDWAESAQNKPTILRFPKAGHFFHGQLGELRERLVAVL